MCAGVFEPHGDTSRTAIRYRGMAIGSPGLNVQRSGDVWYLKPEEALRGFPERVTDRLESGAKAHPDRWLVAARASDGTWVGISYAEMRARARVIGQALLNRNLSAERPIAVLSGNDLEHFQIALGAMWAGIPYAPISPAYSLRSSDYGRLRHVFDVLTPGLIFASDAKNYSHAIDAVASPDIELIAVATDSMAVGHGRKVTAFADLLKTPITSVDVAHDAVAGDKIAKFLFTSGSTNLPKAVPTTHRMMCSNQQMLLQTFPEFNLEPPVLVDWLPWNHTFGGSHNVGIALYNGGTLYIDDGKPVAGKFDQTIRNLREIAPTIYFNVPKGWEELTVALENDPQLRKMFFSRVKTFFFGGAGLSRAAWERLDRVTRDYCGERIPIMAGLGMTETSAGCLFSTGQTAGAGYVGLPAPGCEVKLVPVDGKLEARFRGPHVMTGYWRADEKMRAGIFDKDGYYCSGDALTFVDASRPGLGLMFDGRIAEDFKLSTGTFVSVGPLRARIISDGAPYIQDVAVTGQDRDEIGLLVFPRLDDCRRLAALPADATPADVLSAPAIRAHFQQFLGQLNSKATGGASMIARLRLMEVAPLPELGEVTDKGSVNQRAVLSHRAAVVDSMYEQPEDDAFVILHRS